MSKKSVVLLALILAISACSQIQSSSNSSLSVKDIMNSMVTPMTNIIWGAQNLETDAQWKSVENAAMTIIAAGELMSTGGGGDFDAQWAATKDWQQHNKQMINAANNIIAAVRDRDSEALFDIGNNELYPPCENCHQQFQKR